MLMMSVVIQCSIFGNVLSPLLQVLPVIAVSLLQVRNGSALVAETDVCLEPGYQSKGLRACE